MSLPKRLTSEPTTILRALNGAIPLSDLSEDTIREIGMLDKMKDDLVQLYYQVEVMTLAINAKMNSIASLVGSEKGIPADSAAEAAPAPATDK